MSRNLSRQRETEGRHVHAFLELARRDGLRARAVPCDRPDFVLELPDRRVGLEHRELTEKELASTADNLSWFQTELGAELVRRGADKDLHVAVAVDAASPRYRRRRDLKALVRQIADLALERASKATRPFALEIDRADLYRLGIYGPNFVMIGRTRGHLAAPLASVTRAVAGPVARTVMEAVREKEALLEDYRSRSPELVAFWLLLVTGEGYVQATDSVLTQWTRIETTFERVYLLDLRREVLQRVDDHGEASDGQREG